MKAYPDRLVEAVDASAKGDYWAGEFLRAWLDRKLDEPIIKIRDRARKALDLSFRNIVKGTYEGEPDVRYIIHVDLKDERVEWATDIDAAHVFETEEELMAVQKFIIEKYSHIQLTVIFIGRAE